MAKKGRPSKAQLLKIQRGKRYRENCKQKKQRQLGRDEIRERILLDPNPSIENIVQKIKTEIADLDSQSFSEEEEAILAKKEKQTMRKTLKQQLITIHKMQPNIPLQNLAKIFETPTKNIKRWLKPEEKRIRPKKTSERELEYIKQLGKNRSTRDGGSTRVIAKLYKRKFNKTISHVTVNNYLSDSFHLVKMKKTFVLNAKHIEKRRAFCNYIRRNKITGDQIFFTDEKPYRITIAPNSQNDRIRLTGEDFKKFKEGDEEITRRVAVEIPHTSKFVMIAGGISPYGTTPLFFILGSVTGALYNKMLEQYSIYYNQIMKKANKKVYFQQDGAPGHKKNFIKHKDNVGKTHTKTQFLVDNKFDYVLDWPPHSPDYNSIEKIWGMLDYDRPLYFNNLEELFQRAAKTWINLSHELLLKLANRFDKVIEKSFEVDGKKVEIKDNIGSSNAVTERFFNKLKNSNFLSMCNVFYDLQFQYSLRRKHVTLIRKFFKTVSSAVNVMLNKEKKGLTEKEPGRVYTLVNELSVIKKSSAKRSSIKKISKEVKEQVLILNKASAWLKLVCVVLCKTINSANIKFYFDSIDQYERNLIYSSDALPDRFKYMFYSYRFEDEEELFDFKKNEINLLCEQNPSYKFFDYFSFPSEDVFFDFLLHFANQEIKFYNNEAKENKNKDLVGIYNKKIEDAEQRVAAFQGKIFSQANELLFKISKTKTKVLQPPEKTTSVEDIYFSGSNQPHITTANANFYAFKDKSGFHRAYVSYKTISLKQQKIKEFYEGLNESHQENIRKLKFDESTAANDDDDFGLGFNVKDASELSESDDYEANDNDDDDVKIEIEKSPSISYASAKAELSDMSYDEFEAPNDNNIFKSAVNQKNEIRMTPLKASINNIMEPGPKKRGFSAERETTKIVNPFEKNIMQIKSNLKPLSIIEQGKLINKQTGHLPQTGIEYFTKKSKVSEIADKIREDKASREKEGNVKNTEKEIYELLKMDLDN